MKAHHEDSAVYSVKDQLPPAGEHVLVITADFRCLGFLDKSNIWRHAKDRTLIDGVVLEWTRSRRP